MKIYFILLPFLLTACTHRGAFNEFHITKKQKLSIEELQSTKIKDTKNNANGLVAVLYLNKVDKKEFHTKEYFYVSLYKQNETNSKPTFLLNNKQPITIKKLPQHNRFTKLTSLNAAWLQNYMVIFKKEQGALKFQVKENNSSSKVLLFQQN